MGRQPGALRRRGAGESTTLPGDLLHYTNPNISSYVDKINYFADLYLQRQLAEKARWSAPAAVFRAAWRFVRAYFFRLGFLDGYPGFFIAASTAYSTLVRHSRLFEHLQPAQPVCAPAQISLIISTYERPGPLDQVLRGVQRQSEMPGKFCIADDGSGAATRELIANGKTAAAPVRHVWQPRTSAFARPSSSINPRRRHGRLRRFAGWRLRAA
jgi:hypothetical protein